MYCLVMSRHLVAALALVAGAHAAPTVVLSNHGAGGDAARRVTYESLTQTDVLAGVLRAAGVTPAASGAQWEEELVASLEERPRLVAVLLTEAYGGKQVRPVRQLCFHCTAADRQLCASFSVQELRTAVAAAGASLALVNAEAVEPASLAGHLAGAVAAARTAGGDVSPLVVSDSCLPVRPRPPASLPLLRFVWCRSHAI